jgi:hypothetical protein
MMGEDVDTDKDSSESRRMQEEGSSSRISVEG